MAHESVIQPTAFYRCKQKKRLIAGKPQAISELKAAIDKLIVRSGLTLFGSSIERYSEVEHHGYTYLAWIGESAVDIHTWPEHGTVVANAHVCNLEKRNEDKVVKLFALMSRFYGGSQREAFEPFRIPLQPPEL